MDIQSGKQVPVLLSVMGPKTYGLLCNVVARTSPDRCANIVDALQAHFAPKPLVIAKSFQFHKMNQWEEETVMFVVVLQRLSEHCDFSDFCFVCELKGKTVQKRLLKESLFTMSVVVRKLKPQTIFGEKHKL